MTNITLELSVRNGALTGGFLGAGGDDSRRVDLPETLKGRKLHEVDSWSTFVEAWSREKDQADLVFDRAKVARWLQTMLPSTGGDQ